MRHRTSRNPSHTSLAHSKRKLGSTGFLCVLCRSVRFSSYSLKSHCAVLKSAKHKSSPGQCCRNWRDGSKRICNGEGLLFHILAVADSEWVWRFLPQGMVRWGRRVISGSSDPSRIDVNWDAVRPLPVNDIDFAPQVKNTHRIYLCDTPHLLKPSYTARRLYLVNSFGRWLSRLEITGQSAQFEPLDWTLAMTTTKQATQRLQ